MAIIHPIASPAQETSEGNNQQAPPPSPNLHQWGAVALFHGLPSDHVRAIAQDREGAMWFGTDNGLARYDGRRIQKIATTGMAALRIRALKLDAGDTLWVGTDAGAARFARGEIKPVPETEGKTITAIITPERGRAIMTSEQGMIFDCSETPDGALTVFTIKPQDHPLLAIESRNHAPVQLTSLALAYDSLIVGTRSRGLVAINLSEAKSDLKSGPTLKRETVKEILSRPRAFFVEAIESDAQNNLWFGAQTTTEDSGLFDSTDLTRPSKTGAGLGTVTALRFDEGKNLWAGTDNQGAFLFRGRRRLERFTFENTAGGLRSNHVYSIFVDREGVVWFGTDRGACRYDPHSLRAEAISNDAESNFARALFQSSDGVLWCGTNRGLFARDESGWRAIVELKEKIVHSIAEDAEGRLLVGTASGLFAGVVRSKKHRTDAPTNEATTGGREFSRLESAQGASDNIRAIRSFQGATYVANFGRGLERLDGARRTLVWPDESANERNRQVVSLHAEGDARLWIGAAEAGVFIFDGKQIITNPMLDRFIGAGVWAIDGALGETLWLATARGLYALKSDNLIEVIKDSDVRTVIRTDNSSNGTIWCGTVGGGVHKVRLDDEAGLVVSQLNAEQGLTSQMVFALLRSNSNSGGEEVWVGTSRGVARYKPGRTTPSLQPTRVMGNRVYSREEMLRGISLEYPQDSIALDVAAMSSRTFPEQFQYAFSVFDSHGKVIARKLSRDSQLVIQNLRPGRYRATARAFNNELIRSEPLAFEFEVAGAPFPWTTVALSILLALALVAVWWGYRQNRRMARTNEALESANHQLADTRLQLANETETERRRIARDLHDQTLADLRHLMLLTDQLPAANGNGHKAIEPGAFRDEIENISTEIRRICEDLSPSVLANVGLAAALEWALSERLAHLPAEQRFEYEFECDEAIEEKLKLSPAVQIQVYRIAQEAISNVCRHAAATRVRVRARIDEGGDFIIHIEDNGRGFEETAARARTGRGLANIRSRASLIDARVSWIKRPEGGTIFTLRKGAAVKARII